MSPSPRWGEDTDCQLQSLCRPASYQKRRKSKPHNGTPITILVEIHISISSHIVIVAECIAMGSYGEMHIPVSISILVTGRIGVGSRHIKMSHVNNLEL